MGYGRVKFLEFQYSSLCHFDLILNGKPIPYPLDVAFKKNTVFFLGGVVFKTLSQIFHFQMFF